MSADKTSCLVCFIMGLCFSCRILLLHIMGHKLSKNWYFDSVSKISQSKMSSRVNEYPE